MARTEQQDGFLIELVLGVIGAIFFIFIFFISNKKETLGKNNDESLFQFVHMSYPTDLRFTSDKIINSYQLNNEVKSICKINNVDTVNIYPSSQGTIQYHLINQDIRRTIAFYPEDTLVLSRFGIQRQIDFDITNQTYGLTEFMVKTIQLSKDQLLSIDDPRLDLVDMPINTSINVNTWKDSFRRKLFEDLQRIGKENIFVPLSSLNYISYKKKSNKYKVRFIDKGFDLYISDISKNDIIESIMVQNDTIEVVRYYPNNKRNKNDKKTYIHIDNTFSTSEKQIELCTKWLVNHCTTIEGKRIQTSTIANCYTLNSTNNND